jgi:hypothetical protein
MRFLNFGKDKVGDLAPTWARRAFIAAAIFVAAGAVVVIGNTSAQAYHNGYPHGGGGGYHEKWKSQKYSGHNKWKSQEYRERQEYRDYHSPKRSSYQKRKYYHRQYGSWGRHPQCLHLGPFGVCEY